MTDQGSHRTPTSPCVSEDLRRPDPENVREHSERNLKAIEAALGQFGQQRPMVALADEQELHPASDGTVLGAPCAPEPFELGECREQR